MADPTAGAATGPDRVAHRRTTIGLAVAALTAALLTWAVAVGGSTVAGVDTALTDLTRGWADALDWPVAVAHLVGRLTAPFWSALAAGVVVIWLFVRGHRAASVFLALSGLAGVLTSETVKRLMGRPRPPGAEEYARDLDKSFPSGHSMEGVYLYIAAGLVLIHLGRGLGRPWLQRAGMLLVAIGPIIGLSRLVLGVHWPSDVLAGWAYGSVVLCASALLLWAPLARGWGPPSEGQRLPRDATPEGPARPALDPPPAPPAAGTTPDPPGR